MVTRYRPEDEAAVFIEDTSGEWVKYSDHSPVQASLDAVTAERDALIAQNEALSESVLRIERNYQKLHKILCCVKGVRNH